jgi:hypothetical protein
MDERRFDAVTRTFAAGIPRRVALSVLAGAVLQLRCLIIGKPQAEARKKGKNKKCKPKCAGKACGKNGCGGSCGRCDGACVGGVCVCPDGLRNCNGACRQCCDEAHCENGRSCLQGVCACPRGRAPCPNECCGLFETCEIGMCAAPGPPACDGFSSTCTSGATCCSGACVELLGIRYCDRSELGEPCFVDDDCVAEASCVSYHCFFT